MSKKVVLEEEKYVETLGQIIERDFFPDLPKLKEKTKLLQDEEESLPWTETMLRRASARGTISLRNNGNSSEWDQPVDQSVENDLAKDEPSENSEDNTEAFMTLNRFVATHTSEDNDSFHELQEKAVKDHQRRYHWAYDDNEEKGDPKLHLLTNGTWISKEQRRIADESCAPKGLQDSRPSAPETWKFRARNPLLFPPELEATRNICGVKTTPSSQLRIENGPKSDSKHSQTMKRQTIYANSRFPSEDDAPFAPTYSKEGPLSSREDYSLVPMTPLIAPGVDASPLMTWGDIEGTPAILKATPASILNTPSFELKDMSRREKLANRLETEVRHRNPKSRMSGIKTPSRKRLKINSTPVPRSVRARIASFQSVLRTPLGSDTQLRASYSTPLPPRHSSKTRKMT